MINVAVAGAGGKMGAAIIGIVASDPQCSIVGALEQSSASSVGVDIYAPMGGALHKIQITSDVSEAISRADVFIDFTHFSATQKHLKAAVAKKMGYVLGTTGLNEEVLAAVREASKTIPIVQSFNMSIGVNLLFKLSKLTAEILDEDYDIEIVEAHHRMKKDAPSGTAVTLRDVVTKARKRDLKKDVVYGREGETGARPKGQIGVHAVRGGDVVGDHTVSFLAEGERIELVHRATSREVFAKGAVRAAKFVVRQKPGLYTMAQVLGLE